MNLFLIFCYFFSFIWTFPATMCQNQGTLFHISGLEQSMTNIYTFEYIYVSDWLVSGPFEGGIFELPTCFLLNL